MTKTWTRSINPDAAVTSAMGLTVGYNAGVAFAMMVGYTCFYRTDPFLFFAGLAFVAGGVMVGVGTIVRWILTGGPTGGAKVSAL